MAELTFLISKSALPHGSIFLEMSSHGASFWTRTARILTECETDFKSFFLKVVDLP